MAKKQSKTPRRRKSSKKKRRSKELDYVVVDEVVSHDRSILLSVVLLAIACLLFRNVFSENVSNYATLFFGIFILPNMVCGSQTSFLKGTKSSIRGKYLPEFRGVYEAFRMNVRSGIEKGAQAVVMYKGVVVVDLYTRLESNDSYDAESTQNVWSSTKTVASLAMAMLVDRGLVSYDQKVSEIWPEFGANGKENITVADVLRHEAGLYVFVSQSNSTDESYHTKQTQVRI